MTLGGAPVESFGGRWYVLMVQGGLEKDFARKLAAQSIPYFLPLETIEKRYESKRYVEHRPLFRGYVSINGGSAELYVAQKVRGFVTTVPGALFAYEQARLRRELALVQKMIESGDQIGTPEVVIGDRVRVKTNHPYAGSEGVLMRVKDNFRFVVVIQSFGGRPIDIEIDPDDVEPV